MFLRPLGFPVLLLMNHELHWHKEFHGISLLSRVEKAEQGRSADFDIKHLHKSTSMFASYCSLCTGFQCVFSSIYHSQPNCQDPSKASTSSNHHDQTKSKNKTYLPPKGH